VQLKLTTIIHLTKIHNVTKITRVFVAYIPRIVIYLFRTLSPARIALSIKVI